jgi:hypothetical protein
VVLAYFVFRQRSLAQVEDQRRFSFGHLRLEAAFVEGSAEGVEAVRVAVAAESDESGATLGKMCQYILLEAKKKSRTKNAAAAMPTPMASVDAICRWGVFVIEIAIPGSARGAKGFFERQLDQWPER